MYSCHSYQKSISVYRYYIPRTREFLHLWILVPLSVKSLLSSSDDRQNLFLSDVDFSDCVILRIAQVNEMHVIPVNVTHTLRMMEGSFFIISINKANLSIPYRSLALESLLINYDQTIISSIRYYHEVVIEPLLFFDADELSRISKILSLSTYLLRAELFIFFKCASLSLLQLNFVGGYMSHFVIIEVKCY